MREFVATLPDKELEILDIGSQVVARQKHLGSYRQFFNKPKWKYTGVDIEAGENVDIVLKDGYKLPFNNNQFDVVISGQTIEHMEYPWMWFIEMSRVLKYNGVCCIIAPAKIHEHKYPIDTYRYYPDGMRALAKWAGLEVIDIQRQVVNDDMEDTYLIAKKK